MAGGETIESVGSRRKVGRDHEIGMDRIGPVDEPGLGRILESIEILSKEREFVR